MSKIDLSDIKDKDLDKTSSFTDLMSRSERKNRIKEKLENNDIIDMVEEKKKSTRDLTIELEKAKEKYKKDIGENNEESLSKTQSLELTRQMKFNFEETKKENAAKKGISIFNIIGEINLLCIGYYIYLLVFTNYQDKRSNYLLSGSIVVLLVLLFGLSIITNKKASKLFSVLNILAIIGFIILNTYTLFN